MSVPAYAPTCTYYHSSSDSPNLRGQDNWPLLCLLKKDTKATIKEKKSEITVKSLATVPHFFLSHHFLCVLRIEKGKRHC